MDNSNKLILITLTIILSLNLVLALGVNAPYWQGNPLKMYPGETKEVSFQLANGVNEPTTEATISLTKGNDLAEITSGDKYTVSPGENKENIILKITIPEDAQIDDTYDTGFKVMYIPAGEGNVKLNVEYNVNFPVQVVAQGDESPAIVTDTTNTNSSKPMNRTVITASIIALFIIIVVVIIFILLNRRKDQEKIGIPLNK